MKKKLYLFLSIIIMIVLFTGCGAKKEENPTVEKNDSTVKDSSIEVKFTADGYSMNTTSRAHVSITNYLKEYTYFNIVSADANSNTQYCILQSWDTVSNSAITLNQNIDYEISNATQNLIDVYANVRSVADNSLARCVVTVNFHN